MNGKEFYEECRKSRLDIRISRPAGGEAVEFSMEGTALDLASAALHLVDRVSADVADVRMLIAMRKAILEKIDEHLMDKIIGGEDEPERKETESFSPEKVSELFGKIFGN